MEKYEENKVIPQLSTIVLRGWLGDYKTYAVNVTYPGEDPYRVTFAGDTVHGGPVVMMTHDGEQHFVTEPSRYGDFGPEWVRRFFEE